MIIDWTPFYDAIRAIGLVSARNGDRHVPSDAANSDNKKQDRPHDGDTNPMWGDEAENTALFHLIQGNLEEMIGKLQKSHHDGNSELTARIDKLQELLLTLLKSDIVKSLIPEGPFLHRYQNDAFNDKQEIGHFIARTYFKKSPRHCFVQASTSALHLAYAIEKEDVCSGCLIHTNSAVMPLPLIWGACKGRVSTWSFCGKLFSPICGGWQIPQGDAESYATLRGLFTRPSDPLTTAILMPTKIFVSDGIYYEDRDAAILADEVASVAQDVLIVAPSNRVHEDKAKDKIIKDRPLYPALKSHLVDAPGRFTYVISGMAELRPSLVDVLRGQVGKVWWRSKEGWREIESRNAM